MFQTANDYVLILPDGEQLLFGTSEDDPRFCGYVNSVSSAAEVAQSRTKITGADGAVVGPSYLDGRSVVLNVSVIDADPAVRAATLEKIYRVYAGLTRDLTLEWREATGVWKSVRGLRVSNYPALEHGNGPRKEVQIALFTPEPFIQAADLHQAQNLPGGTYDIYNLGNAIAYPVFKVTGSSFNGFTITNKDNGQQLTVWRGSAINAETVTIDCSPLRRTVKKEAENFFPYLSFNASDFFGIEPGGSSIEFAPAGSATLTVEWRSSWLG